MNVTALTDHLVFENASGTAQIYLYHHLSCGQVTLLGDISHEDYKEVFLKFIDVMEAHGYCDVIYDTSHLIQHSRRSRAWYLTHYLPQAVKRIKSDRYKIGVIAPNSLIQRVAVEFVVRGSKALGKPFIIRYFDALSEATAWMEE